MDVLIAGAGIGGLTTARTLQARGHRVQVLEQAPELRDGGAGITLQPNAIGLLDTLGLSGPLTDAGCTFRFSIQRADGVLLGAQGVGDGLTGWPTVGIARSELSRQLYAGLTGDPVRFGQRVEQVRSAHDGVEVRTAVGDSFVADVLVAADGIHSPIREQLFGPHPLRYAGYTCWRGLAGCASGLPEGQAVERWGRGRRFGIVPVAADRTYWFATLNAPAGGEDGPEIRARLQELFADFVDPVGTLIDTTPEVLRNDIVDLAPLDRWVDGRVALLGDAAHAMTPNMGQGACQAIEDAFALAAHLDADPVQDLLSYQQARLDRARWFVDTSEQIGRVAQWAHPLAVGLRDTAARLTPAWVQNRSLERAWTVPS